MQGAGADCSGCARPPGASRVGGGHWAIRGCTGRRAVCLERGGRCEERGGHPLVGQRSVIGAPPQFQARCLCSLGRVTCRQRPSQPSQEKPPHIPESKLQIAPVGPHVLGQGGQEQKPPHQHYDVQFHPGYRGKHPCWHSQDTTELAVGLASCPDCRVSEWTGVSVSRRLRGEPQKGPRGTSQSRALSAPHGGPSRQGRGLEF